MIKISNIEYKNRKTISVSINTMGEVIVRAPIGCPVATIEKFITSKQDWIESKQRKMCLRIEKFSDIMSYQKLMILGKSYYGYSSGAVKKITISYDKVLIPLSVAQDKLHGKITRWYHKYAEEILIPRTREISKLVGLTPTNIKCTGSRGRWGACNSNGELFLNWRCVMLSPNLIDYVIVHELVHLLELNHSPKFWEKVEKLLPDYKKRRKELKEYGFCLKLF